jgi:hypothetical protein
MLLAPAGAVSLGGGGGSGLGGFGTHYLNPGSILGGVGALATA